MLTHDFPCTVLHRRNIACIGCGATRATLSPTSNRPPLSPRFASSPNAPTVYPPSTPSPARPSVSLPSSISQSKNGHPLLTPSGRAFAVGGRVQNISYDPLLPCVMYWPDNEPFPESGQIRPNGLVAIPHPPILNTGNRGPIAHQPGDWICKTCNYLNWRRRKVYAEGNGDSISAAVQAERIALLTSVLTQHQGPGLHTSLAPLRTHVLRAHSVTPPQVRRPFVDVSPPQSRGPYRSQSQVELGSQYMHQERLLPIYQTSGHRRPSPPKQSLSQQQQQQQLHHRLQIQQLQQQLQQLELHAPTPAPLLPSFLQDIVQSPTLSPSSTSSADLSLTSTSTKTALPRPPSPLALVTQAMIRSTWLISGRWTVTRARQCLRLRCPTQL
ncbi:hypothetical protein D9757_003352 [Collybiopsis confluens]|uniref:Uncharacterized protein n=1 Tax=Collybiopsis confluens TaxID=2823264 RepID=A0A8H5HZ52_9AGAR|nr:hypothetical protein D9757_003352 [Collybiopsis confluens]